MPYALKPAELLVAWQQYKKRCDEHTVEQRYRNEVLTIKKPKIYVMELFCCLVGLDEDELDKLRENRNYRKVIRQIEYAVLARKLDALVNGEGNASGLIFDLKANHGLHIKKAQKALKDKEWNVTLDLGNGNIERYGKSVSQKDSKSVRKKDALEGDGALVKEDDDSFIWDAGRRMAGDETEGFSDELTIPEIQPATPAASVAAPFAERPKDPLVVGEPIIITKQPETRSPLENDRMVEVMRTDPFTGETFTINVWLSSLSDREREKFTKPKGWMPQGSYCFW